MKRGAVLLIIAGLLIAGYPLAERLYTWYWQQRILSAWEDAEPAGRFPEAAEPEQEPAEPQQKGGEVQGYTPLGILIIDKIDMRLPILKETSRAALWVGAGLWEGGAGIGEKGNTVLTSHRAHAYGRLFNRLDELAPGDEIVIETRSARYRYTVYDRKIVRADEFTPARPAEGESMLTLFTCHPLNRVNAPDRLVILARAAGASADQGAGG